MREVSKPEVLTEGESVNAGLRSRALSFSLGCAEPAPLTKGSQGNAQPSATCLPPSDEGYSPGGGDVAAGDKGGVEVDSPKAKTEGEKGWCIRIAESEDRVFSPSANA